MRWFCLFAVCSLFAAVGPVAPKFVDVAAQFGITAANTSGGLDRKDFIIETTGAGVAILDYDNDGLNDVLLVNGTTISKNDGPPRTSHLYRNLGSGKFADVSVKAGFTEEGWGQGVCAGDYNNDGYTDLMITYYGHNRLYRNNGAGFVNVTAEAHLPATGRRYGSGCAFFDYDNDGYLDLIVSNYVDLDLDKTPKPGSADTCEWKGIPVMCGPRGLPKAFSALYHNNRDGTFSDVSQDAGILAPGGRYGLGILIADFDHDGRPDIYIACDMTPSLLYHNMGNGKFVERAAEAGVAYNVDGRLQAGMGVALGDFNNDGLLDIAKTNFSGDLPSLFHNDDGQFFTDTSREAGLGAHQLLGWGITFTDLDFDGWQDLLVANGHVYPEVERSPIGETYKQLTLAYRNLGNGRFADITSIAGPAFQTPRSARGLAIGDLDNDGIPEIVINNMNDAPSVLRNMIPALGNRLIVKLRGTKSNRSAIGATLRVKANGMTQTQVVTSGESFYSQHEFTRYFGLAKATTADLEVWWPSGLKQTWTNVPANRPLSFVEAQQAYSGATTSDRLRAK